MPVNFQDYTVLPSHLANHVYVPDNFYSTHLSEPPLNYKKYIRRNEWCDYLAKKKEWCESMNDELAALEANATYELMSLPSYNKTVGV